MSESFTGPDSLSPFRVNRASRVPSGSLVYVGVVHVADTICHVCAGTSRDRLVRRLGEYVREQADYQLCPGDAQRALALLGEGRVREAVDLYLGAANQRWDRERLVVRRVLLQGDPWNGR